MSNLTRSLLVTLSLALSCPALAAPETTLPAPAPSQPVIHPVPPAIDAKSYILIDADSGKVLAEKNADVRLPPASLTKLMTMYVISDALKRGVIHPGDKARISAKAWRTGGSRMFVRVNDEVPVEDLLKGIVVASGNDATVAMAEYIAGTENAFTGLMNAQAARLGMTNSHFTDSNGLPNADHYSTARDLSTLTRAIIRDFPEDYRLYSEKWFTWNNIRQPNRNRLLWHFPEADGLKTGHTNEAGFCLVGSAKKGSTRLVSVVMGDPSDTARTEDSMRLLTYGFRFFETRALYQGSTRLTDARVWKGAQKTVPLGLQAPLYVTLPVGQLPNVHATLTYNPMVQAPIKKGDSCGSLTVTLNNEIIATAPLVALEDNNRGGLWRQMADTFHFNFNRLFPKHGDTLNRG